MKTRNPKPALRQPYAVNRIALHNALSRYSKPTLVELVLELRDRFAHTYEVTRQKDQHITLLLKKVKQQQVNLADTRKKLRSLTTKPKR